MPASAVANAPYPYTAEQIRDATRQGRTWEYRVEEAGRRAPRTRVMTVTASTDENVEIEVSLREGRRVVEPPVRATSTWDELRQHATFPAASTLIGEESVTTPAGTFACRVYTVARPGAEGQPPTLSRFFFANELPGAPVLFYTESGGQRVMTQTLVRHVAPPRP